MIQKHYDMIEEEKIIAKRILAGDTPRSIHKRVLKDIPVAGDSLITNTIVNVYTKLGVTPPKGQWTSYFRKIEGLSRWEARKVSETFGYPKKGQKAPIN
jgi:hypothetical protein